MNFNLTKFDEKRIHLEYDNLDVKVVYHSYEDVELNTLLVSFIEKRNVLSTLDGFKTVNYVANTYVPPVLSEQVMTLKSYEKFQRHLPLTLGIKPSEVTLMSTGVNMEKLAVCEKTYEELKVCCIATAGAKNNALRAGIDTGPWIEKNSTFQLANGTINILLLTNATLTCGAMARAIITATEAKTAALQDRDVRSTTSPKVQATGTGTDSMIIVSGVSPDIVIRHTGGHTKIGELIGYTTKNAVAEALIKHDN